MHAAASAASRSPLSDGAANVAPRWPRLGVLALLLLLLLAACSVVRTLYVEAPHLIYWRLNRAFEFDAAQARQVKAELGGFFAWHRQHELPVYAAWIEGLQPELAGELTPERQCQRRDEVQALVDRSVEQGLPAMARVARTLTARNLKALDSYWEDFNEDFRDDYLPDDEAERLAAATRFARRWIEFFYDDLDRDQREALRRDVAALPFDARDAWRELQRYQADLRQTLQRVSAPATTQAQAEQALRELIVRAMKPQEEPRRSQMQAWIRGGCSFSAAVHKRMHAAQRAELQRMLGNWARDFRILSRGS